jgi:hypothetical protein
MYVLVVLVERQTARECSSLKLSLIDLIDKITAIIQSNMTAIRAFELATFRSDTRLRREKIIRHFLDLDNRVHE